MEPKIIKKDIQEDKIINNQKKVLVLSILCMIVLLLSSSYAIMTNFTKKDDAITFSTGNLEMTILNGEETFSLINLNNKLPESDQSGLARSTVIPITLKNTGTMIIGEYTVKLISDLNKVSTLSEEYIRFSISEDNISYSTPSTLTDNDNVIFTGKDLEVEQTKTIYLKIWLKETAGTIVFNNVFNGTLKIDLEQQYAPNLDESGANEPVLLDNMIPVYYDMTSATEGVWRKADSKNTNEDYKWYDYNNFMWANAVTVKKSGTKTRDEYMIAPAGTEINEADILSMWVWIPRYTYTIFNGNNGTSSEQLINVRFEDDTTSSGTVKCYDNILTSTTSSSSETCADTTNGSIINGTSTYTHPAFCFGTKNTDGSCNGEELTGFWVAKFHMSTDNTITSCTSSSVTTSCNTADINILIKPSVVSLRYQTISNAFASIRRMETYGNIHGFSQSATATTWLDSNSYLTGEIKGDNNNIDIHMQKNMEWGAVAYLSQSKYGKWSNPLYSGDYRRVYKNNYYNSTGTVYKTGYSAGIYNLGDSLTTTYLYNDLTITSEGQGYRGAGASTTGTVYGVYDVSGGSYQYVMANMVSTSGTMTTGSAGTWTGSNFPLEKYYDKYSYNSSGYTAASQTRGKLGDATKETTTTLGSETGGWGGVYRNMPISSTPWLLRAARANGTTIWGIFNTKVSTGASSSSGTTRPTLVIINEEES